MLEVRIGDGLLAKLYNPFAPEGMSQESFLALALRTERPSTGFMVSMPRWGHNRIFTSICHSVIVIGYLWSIGHMMGFRVQRC